MAGKPRLEHAHVVKRRLRDISHLYLSNPPTPGTTPGPSRRLRVGIAAGNAHAERLEVCVNLAVQFARLGRRTVIVDLDPRLPNTGFLLGLEPEHYLAHLCRAPAVAVHRAVQGIRVVLGVARHGLSQLTTEAPERAPGIAAAREEIRNCDCLLLSLPTAPEAADVACLMPEGGQVAASLEPTTMTRAGLTSPMVAAWLAGARAAASPAGAHVPAQSALPGAVQTNAPAASIALPGAGDALVDALLYVRDREADEATTRQLGRLRATLRPGVAHLVEWGNMERQPGAAAWARLEPYATPAVNRLPFTTLYPEHAAARSYGNMAQALLASGSGRGKS